MTTWFFPWWSGDVRFERSEGKPEECLLTVVEPTAADRKVLSVFLAQARREGWMDELSGVSPTGETRLVVRAPLLTAGPAMMVAIHGDAATWTAIRHVDGVVSVHDGAELVTVKPDDVAVVTVREPKRGCPEPEPCKRRASEVLRAYCTTSQWRQWQAEGRLQAIGNATGKAYHVYHRNEAARHGLLRSLVDVSSGDVICAWDATVPSEEEALGLKLAVEHREHWLLDFPAMRIHGPVLPALLID